MSNDVEDLLPKYKEKISKLYKKGLPNLGYCESRGVTVLVFQYIHMVYGREMLKYSAGRQVIVDEDAMVGAINSHGAGGVYTDILDAYNKITTGYAHSDTDEAIGSLMLNDDFSNVCRMILDDDIYDVVSSAARGAVFSPAFTMSGD